MSTTPDGGPAFPTPSTKFNNGDGDCILIGTTGMSLRDYFAAKAMDSVLVSADNYNDRAGIDDSGDIDMITFTDVARDCYRIADAMLAEREKKQP